MAWRRARWCSQRRRRADQRQAATLARNIDFGRGRAMKTTRVWTLLTLATLASGQTPEHWYDNISRPYQAKYVGPVSFENSPRIESLLRGGKLYLSLEDAIALALENNLDIELQRFAPGLAESDLLRAKGGATLRGLTLSVNELPQGVGGPASPLLNLPASGVTPTTSVPN